MSLLYRPLNMKDIHELRYIFMETALDFVFYGVQTTLMVAALIVLARRSGRSRFILGALFGLYLSSSIVVIAHVVSYLVQTPVEVGTSTRDLTEFLLRVDYLMAVAERFNYIVSDIIVTWRAWVIWSDSRVARGVLLFSLSGSIAGIIVECVWVMELVGTTASVPKPRTLVQTIPVLLTNAVATTLIGMKIWSYRREIKGNLGLSTRRSQVEKVLFVLVESGYLYCLIWIVQLVFKSVIGSNGFTSTRLIGTALHSISGIYPTSVVLIALHSNTTQALLTSQISHALHFEGASDVPDGSVDSDMPAEEGLTMQSPVTSTIGY